jgi:hypothetical protein
MSLIAKQGALAAFALTVATVASAASAQAAPNVPAERTSSVAPDERRPVASFDWRMTDRFGLDNNRNGILDMPNSFEYSHNLEPGTCRRVACGGVVATFEITLMAALTGVDSTISDVLYKWDLTGAGIVGSIHREASLPELKVRLAEGQYDVTLTAQYKTYNAAGRPKLVTTSTVQSVPVTDMLIVALGDSMSSGEGNPERRTDPSRQCFFGFTQPSVSGALRIPIYDDRIWGDDGVSDLSDCSSSSAQLRDHMRSHRSSLAWPAQAALAIEVVDPRSSVTFISVAASGATIGRGLIGEYPGVGNESLSLLAPMPSQIDQVKALVGNRRIDALTISIGINDIGFANVLKALLDTDPVFDRVTYYSNIDEIGRAVRTGDWDDPGHFGPFSEFGPAVGLDRLPHFFGELSQSIRTRLGDDAAGNVYLMEYPDATQFVPRFAGLAAQVLRDVYFREGRVADCGSILEGLVAFEELDSYEAGWARSHVLQPLNEAVRTAADVHHWTYIGGVAQESAPHGYCGSSPYEDSTIAAYGLPETRPGDFLSLFSLYPGNPRKGGTWRSAEVDDSWPSAREARWFRQASESSVLQGRSVKETKGSMHPNEYGHRAMKEHLLDHLVYPPGHPWAGGDLWTGAGSRGHDWYVGDFNGDGRDDVLRLLNDDGGAEVLLSDGSAFAGIRQWTAAGFRGSRWYVGDFNKDRKDDLLRILNEYGGAEVLLSDGTKFGPPRQWSTAGFRALRWYVGDFNGDGYDDLLRVLNEYGGAEVLLSDGTKFGSPRQWTAAGFRTFGWLVGDFDGNGKDDLLRLLNEYGGAEVLLSDGTKFGNTREWSAAGSRGRRWLVGDFDGDGKDDLLRVVDDYQGAEVFLSDGIRFGSRQTWTLARNRQHQWMVGNFDGRSGTDLLRVLNEFGGAEVFGSNGQRFVPLIR